MTLEFVIQLAVHLLEVHGLQMYLLGGGVRMCVCAGSPDVAM